jgi:hypothetical protein
MILVGLPILLSLLLFAYVWFKMKEKEILSLILFIVSILIPVASGFGGAEWMQILSFGSLAGWIISIIPSKRISADSNALILKHLLSSSFMLGFIMLFIASEKGWMLYGNYYANVIVMSAGSLTVGVLVLIGFIRIRKILKSAKAADA